VRDSALSWIRRADDDVLVVYNKRFGGYGLPGGMFEEELDHDIEDTQRRELLEETGLKTKKATLIYKARHTVQALEGEARAGRGSVVHVFVVEAEGEPESREGTDVRWMNSLEFMKQSPFWEFYEEMFARTNAAMHLMPHGATWLGQKLLPFYYEEAELGETSMGLRYDGDLRTSPLIVVQRHHHNPDKMFVRVWMVGLPDQVMLALAGDWVEVERQLSNRVAEASRSASLIQQLLMLAPKSG
jgi:ADP-ribose pyrophosphatase YjhB (NUDIX family)